jgi:glycosidase
MPDFNLKNPAVINWHLDNLRFWLNRGVDGFRLDAVGHLVENGPSAWDNQPENVAILKGLQNLVTSYSNRYLVCEGPGAPVLYASEAACGSAFAFSHNTEILRAAKGDAAAARSVASYPLRVGNGNSTSNGGNTMHRMATMLSNHDSFAGDRIWNQMGGDVGSYKTAASAYLLMPGVPFVYYGEEVGLSRASSLSGDHGLRTPMPWDTTRNNGFSSGTPFRAASDNVNTANVATQAADSNSILNHYRAVLALRSARPSLLLGDYRSGEADSGLAFVRSTSGAGAQITGVLINMSNTAKSMELSGFAAGQNFGVLMGGTGTISADAQGRVSVNLPARATFVFGS